MAEPDDNADRPGADENRRDDFVRALARTPSAAARPNVRPRATRGAAHHVKWILINVAWIIAVAWLYAHFLIPRLTAYLERGPG